MSFKERVLLLVEDDHIIFRLLLLSLFTASLFLHYVNPGSSYDPVRLRIIMCFFSGLTLCLSFSSFKSYYRSGIYATVLVYLAINNCILLGLNGFKYEYLFSAITVFIALTLFCQKKRDFVIISVLNFTAVTTAYFIAPVLYISIPLIFALFLVFLMIATISYIVIRSYRRQFEKAINKTLRLNESLRKSQEQLHALISSVNDTIFEFDENRVCVNVWFGPQTPHYLNRRHFLNKTLAEAFGAEKAKPFNDIHDYVLKHRQATSVEFASIYGEPSWFLAKSSPVIDINGNYSRRISVTVTDISEQKKHADALTENKNLLLQAQAIAKTGNWWYDIETKENFWSDNLFNLLEIETIPAGLKKFEYYMHLVHADDMERVGVFFRNTGTENANSIEHKFISPKGTLKYIKILKGEPGKDVNGSIKRIIGIIQDITETKLNEKAIKKSRAELIEAQVIAKIGNWKWDNKYNLLEWSEEINAIYEINAQNSSLSGFIRLFLKYTHPEDRHVFNQFVRNTGSVGTLYEYRIITPKGNLKYISLICGRTINGEDGLIRKVIGTLQDITQRKLAEIKFKITENKYRLVLETIKLAAISLDAQANIIFCNKYLANLLGYHQNEILGMNWMENFVPEDLRVIMKNWFADNSIKAHFINPVICRNGELRTISWQNTVSYDDNGNITGTTSIGEDITLQQIARQELITAKEEAEKSSNFKSEFLSIMSHEIRTPMNAVIGTTNLLLSEDPKPEQLEYLNTLKFSGENLLVIINDILDYNKIEAGKLQLNHSPFDIYQLVQNIRQSFYAKALEKNIKIELIIDNQIPAMLTGDQIRLGQILINLINNAVKFTPAGSVSIKLKKEKICEKLVLINFEVKDTGIGIPAESLKIIFDPFVQGAHAINNDYGGTGLGLAITKKLIELHKSTIHVKSIIGKGTQFIFSVFFDLAPLATPEPKVTLTPAVQNLFGMKILVVDDNKMNLMIASKFLRKWQAHTDEAVNGQIAVDMVANNYYDLVIMDLQMPVMDGFVATAIIKSQYPDMPVIAFTADAMPETNHKALKAGMCDFLTKPFMPDVLFEKISKYHKSVIV